MVGEGPEYNKARQRVVDLGLQHAVDFLGKQDEVAPLVAAADLLLLPSEKESFGLVALEAMSCGIPVIGSTAGGIPEVVTHGETGCLANVGDVETMAQSALSLLCDKDKYQRFAKAARKTAETRFHVRDKVGEYEDVYRRALGRR